MRLYTFVNFYLSSIQQGIQSAHLVHDLFLKYPQRKDRQSNVLWDWATDHKTMIVLNGGINKDIEEKFDALTCQADALGLPYGFFKEDEQSLGGIMTCCGVVLPERLYDVTFDKDEGAWRTNSIYREFFYEMTPESELINLIKSCPLAR